MIVEVLGGLGVRLLYRGERLELEPPRGHGLFTNSPPRYLPSSPEGKKGPFSWRPVKFDGLRGPVTGYEIEAGDLKVVYAGGALAPFSVRADLLIAPAGGLWYADAKAFCKSVRNSDVKVAVPVALWEQGSQRLFDGLEEVKRECRGLRRVRAVKRWRATFEGSKKTVALIGRR